MPDSKIVGRKVKVLPHGVFYVSDNPEDNVGIIVSCGSDFVNVQFGAGAVYPFYPNELSYMNNRGVVLDA